MNEQKIHDALIVARELLLMEGYAEDNLAIVKIDEALTKQTVATVKMREALEEIKALTEIPFAHTAGDHELIYQIATEALAQQPVDYPDLRDALESMIAAFAGGGVEVPLSERVAAIDKACKAIDQQPAAGVGLTDAAIDRAAQVLAELMDYPWAYMPEQGRNNMRKIAAAVIDEAKKSGGGV